MAGYTLFTLEPPKLNIERVFLLLTVLLSVRFIPAPTLSLYPALHLYSKLAVCIMNSFSSGANCPPIMSGSITSPICIACSIVCSRVDSMFLQSAYDYSIMLGFFNKNLYTSISLFLSFDFFSFNCLRFLVSVSIFSQDALKGSFSC